MKLPYYRFRLFHLLTVSAVVVVAVLLWYSNRLVQTEAQGETQRLKFYAEAMRYIAAHQDDGQADFLWNKVVKEGAPGLISFSTILTDGEGQPIDDNLHLDPSLSKEERARAVADMLASMQADKSYPPIKVEYVTGQYNYIYYTESPALHQLRFFPYITLIVILLFIAGAFVNYYISYRDNQNRIWAGLAKETAHQLGTPLSGMMAWIELLKLQPHDSDIVMEMERDVKQLQNIAERFSKIGSEPELTAYPLAQLLSNASEYVRSRSSRAGQVSITLENFLPDGYLVEINPTLFEWVIENLLKNALDALHDRQGIICIRAYARTDSDNQVVLEVEDTGKGIPKKHLKDVFKPGFTTKLRGWGLGLSLSRRIIENYHHGRIFVRRSEIGKGTTFRIILPAPAKTALWAMVEQPTAKVMQQ